MSYKPYPLARIREEECVGCTKCIDACPVDAIIGSAQHTHTVISQECIGCKLCIAPCPVDCIDLITVPQRLYDSQQAKLRAKMRKERLLRDETEKANAYQQAKETDLIQTALARVKLKK